MTECCAFFSTYYCMTFCWLFHFIDFVLAASRFQECKYHWPWHSGSLLDKPAAHWEPHWTQSGSGDWCTIRIHCFVSDPWIHESAPGEGNEDLPTGPREARKDKRYLMIWKYLKRELIGTNTKQTKGFFIFISCTHSHVAARTYGDQRYRSFTARLFAQQLRGLKWTASERGAQTGSPRPHDKWMLKLKWRLSLNSLCIWYVDICRELWIPAELEYSTHYIMIIYIVWFTVVNSCCMCLLFLDARCWGVQAGQGRATNRSVSIWFNMSSHVIRGISEFCYTFIFVSMLVVTLFGWNLTRSSCNPMLRVLPWYQPLMLAKARETLEASGSREKTVQDTRPLGLNWCLI